MPHPSRERPPAGRIAAFLLRDFADEAARRFGFEVRDATWTPELSALRLTLERPGNPVQVWIRNRAEPGASFRETARFKVVYQAAVPDPDLPAVIGRLADRIALTEDRIPDAAFQAWFGRIATTPTFGVVETQLRLALTTRCNERCPFCSLAPEDMNSLSDPAAVEAALRAAAGNGTPEVVFTGGEPTLVPELPAYVRLARSLGLRVTLQTNGRIPARPSWWDGFREADGTWRLPDTVTFSFHTIRADRLKELTGVAGTMPDKIAAIRRAVALGIEVNLNWVVSVLNLDELPDLPDFVAREFGRDASLSFSFVAPTWRAREETWLIPRIADVVPRLREALDRAERLRVFVVVLDYCGLPPCVLPTHRRFFETDRAAVLAPQEDALRTKFPACAGCRYDDRCRGFWRTYVELHGADEFRAVPADA